MPRKNRLVSFCVPPPQESVISVSVIVNQSCRYTPVFRENSKAWNATQRSPSSRLWVGITSLRSVHLIFFSPLKSKPFQFPLIHEWWNLEINITLSLHSSDLQFSLALRLQEINLNLSAQSNSITLCLHHDGTLGALCWSTGRHCITSWTWLIYRTTELMFEIMLLLLMYLCSCPTPATRNLPVLENFKLFTKPFWKRKTENSLLCNCQESYDYDDLSKATPVKWLKTNKCMISNKMLSQFHLTLKKSHAPVQVWLDPVTSWKRGVAYLIDSPSKDITGVFCLTATREKKAE